MLDLKAKLAAAGVVTDDQVKKVEAQQARKAANRRKPKSSGGSDKAKTRSGGKAAARPGGIDIAAYQSMGKGEAYLQFRKVVEKRRLDGSETVAPSEHAKVFTFRTIKGGLGRLWLEPEVFAKVEAGEAGVCAYMSNNGLAHCALPRDLVISVSKVFELWVRSLKGFERAGLVEEPPVDTKPDPATDNPGDS